jgi:hypothetical protein
MKDTACPTRLPGLVGLEAHRGAHVLLQDGVRVFGRHLLDVHPALGRGHDHGEALGPVDEGGEVHLLRPLEVHALLDEEPPHDSALRARLVGAQRHPQHRLGDALAFVEALRDLDAAALAAAAGVDLGLHHHREPETLGHLPRLLDGVGHLAFRHRDPVLGENRLALVLVDLHGWNLPRGRRPRPITAAPPRR